MNCIFFSKSLQCNNHCPKSFFFVASTCMYTCTYGMIFYIFTKVESIWVQVLKVQLLALPLEHPLLHHTTSSFQDGCQENVYRTLAKLSPPFSARTLGDWGVFTRIYAHPGLKSRFTSLVLWLIFSFHFIANNNSVWTFHNNVTNFTVLMHEHEHEWTWI